MAKIELKQPIVKAIAEDVKDACAVVLVDHRGLTVEQDTVLRKKLREAGIDYKVRKNTMMNLAFEGTPYEELRKVLEGPSAIAISRDDATAPARMLAEFAKTAPALEFKAGVIDGTFYDAEGVKQIASIPSRDVLLGRLLGSMQSPIANFARVLKQIAEKDGSAVETAPASEAPAAEEAPVEAAPAEETPAEASAEASAEEAPAEAPAEEAPAEETPAEEAPAEEAPAEEKPAE